MKVTVNTKKYEWAHGKSPRGQGFWAFYIGPLEEGPEEPTPAFIPGRYGEAKRKAVDFAKELGEDQITVMP